MAIINVILSKASRVSDHHPAVPNLIVEAERSCDEELGPNRSERSCDLFFSSQARTLVSAFLRTLPGALIDAILIELMKTRAVQLHVPLVTDPE